MVFGANTYRLFARMLASSTEESEVRDPWVSRMRSLPATVVSGDAPVRGPAARPRRAGMTSMKLPHGEHGDGDAVLLLHAGIADRRMWDEHLEPLAAAGYRGVAVDLPGFGEAALEQGPVAHWEDVVETMDALGIERAALVGNSFGGAVALRVAALHPERITALLLFSASSRSWSRSPTRWRRTPFCWRTSTAPRSSPPAKRTWSTSGTRLRNSGQACSGRPPR